MSSNNCIIPECYIDSCLVEVLLNVKDNYVNHQKGNGKVAREMKNKFAGAFCVGIIDEDRKRLDYLSEFSLAINANELKLWKHKTWPQYIIQVCPVIESWIISASKLSGLSLENYNLPGELFDLLKVTKAASSKSDQRFIRLFKDLLKSENKVAVKLKNWLDFLNANKYNADLNRLKNG